MFYAFVAIKRDN